MKKKINIMVVCNDAGGAEIVSAFVFHYQKKYHFFCVAEGPAAKIFKRKKLQSLILKHTASESVATIFGKLPPISKLITGTSWTTSRELDFIQIANQKKIKTVSYMDHWVHYRERFGWPHKEWKKNLPYELWVGDCSALTIARKIFTARQPIRLVPNLFFKEIQANYSRVRSAFKSSSHGILIATEPISLPMNYLGDTRAIQRNEYEIVEEIVRFLAMKKYAQPVIIRVHPSEPKNKYNAIVKKYRKDLDIQRSRETEMLKDLVRVRTVVGMESMFLVVAWLCRKEVISFLPDTKRLCPLPFSGIKKIKTIDGLTRFLRSSV